MSLFTRLIGGFGALVRKARAEQDLDAEVRAFLETAVEVKMRAGMNREQAVRAARVEFGSIEAVKDYTRDVGWEARLENVWRDLRYALRMLRRSPGFAAVAILTLALGIGANAAMFSFADATLLRPVPFDEPDRLMMVRETSKDFEPGRVAPLNFADWREQNRTFETMASVTGTELAMQAPDGTPQQIPGQSVSVDFFRVLRVQPILGRTFTADDAPNALVISERFWGSRFDNDPEILGRSIRLDGEPYQVIGIVPREFQFLSEAVVWRLFSPRPGPYLRRTRFLDVIGRLKPGVTLEAARADMRTVAENIAAAWPATNKGRTAVVDPLGDAVVSDELQVTSLVLAGVVGCVLLIACTNVASLVMTRGAGRAREFAVRAALGAGRRRVIAQLLIESMILTVIGGVAGLAICLAVVRAAPSLIPAGLLPPSIVLAVDGPVLGFCAMVSVAIGIVFGLAPAWRATRISLTQAIGSGTRGSTAKLGSFRMLLATVEIAAAVLLLCGAGLLLRTLLALTNVDPGYRAENVLTMRVTLPRNQYNTHERMLTFFDGVEREVSALPGVRAAGWGTALPLDGSPFGMNFEIVGAPQTDEMRRPSVTYQMISTRYLQTVGIAIVRGRGFDERDVSAGKPVCLVNEEFARRYLQGRDPVGAQIRVAPMGALGATKPVTREVVGIVRQVKERPQEMSDPLAIYVPLAQNAWTFAHLAVRAETSEPEALTPTIRAAVARVDPNLPVTRVRTLDDIAREATSRPRFRAQLVTAFAALALILATVGLFGVLAFSVQQRVPEFGVRIAVGATPSDVLRIVLANMARITVAGVGLGLFAAALLSRSLDGLLFGVKALDALTFTVVAAIAVATAMIASAVPAYRAACIDPLVALRYE